MVIRQFDKDLQKLVARQRLLVLRKRGSNVALNVSYTEDGLKWTCNKVGRLLYYKSGIIKDGSIYTKDTEMSSDVYVEPFVPRNFSNEEAQVIEYTWCKKALAMMY